MVGKGILFMQLLENEAQEEAIRTIDGPVIIVSCPGSGKTTTLVRRIHHMIESGIPPAKILMVTFTRDAARGMQEKYVALFGTNPGIQFATIHSLCFNILKLEGRCNDGDVLAEDKKHAFLFDYLKSRKLGNDAWEMAQSASTEISVIKNNYLTVEEHNPNGISKQILADCYRVYESWKEENGMLDFDDMLIRCRKMLQEEPYVLDRYQEMFRYIQCDEYQDTNFIQRDILYALSAKYRNLCVVGDDDQSIYAFRGARPEVMLSFTKDLPDAKVIMMGTNYRSAQAVVDRAGDLIRHNANRYRKEFLSERGAAGIQGKLTTLRFSTKREEMEHVLSEVKRFHEAGVPYKEMAVIFRTNQQAQLPVQAFAAAGIPYYSTETVKSRYESFLFSDIKDYVSLACGTGGNREFLSVLNRPLRYWKEAFFRDCEYTPKSFRKAAKAQYKDEPYWKLQKAYESIDDWFNAFGPGKLSYSSAPSSIFPALTGRKGSIHYDTYMTSYAEFRNMDFADVKEIYDDLKADAAQFETIDDWFDHAEMSVRRLREETRKKDREGVVITTMHRAKGLEWQVVFIIDADEKVIPHKKSVGVKRGIEEERRLFYVAITRAKDEVQILGCASPSRFLRELFFVEKKGKAGKASSAIEISPKQ